MDPVGDGRLKSTQAVSCDATRADTKLPHETRRKPTTGRQSPSLIDKWHGILYMPSRIDEAGHTKAFESNEELPTNRTIIHSNHRIYQFQTKTITRARVP